MNFLLWGLFFGVLLVIEKLLRPLIKVKLPGILGHIYMLVLVIFGWVLFAIEDFNVLFAYLGNMFGSSGIWDAANGYFVMKYIILLVIAAIGSTPLPKKAVSLLEKMLPGSVMAVLRNLFIMALLLASVALIVGDTYNPFLYFRF